MSVTPEERAKKIVDEWQAWADTEAMDRNNLIARIADDIRAAVEEENKRVIGIAKMFVPSHEDQRHLIHEVQAAERERCKPKPEDGTIHTAHHSKDYIDGFLAGIAKWKARTTTEAPQ